MNSPIISKAFIIAALLVTTNSYSCVGGLHRGPQFARTITQSTNIDRNAIITQLLENAKAHAAQEGVAKYITENKTKERMTDIAIFCAGAYAGANITMVSGYIAAFIYMCMHCN